MLGLKINGNYVACAQQLAWIKQWAERLRVPTDARNDPDCLKRFADVKGALMHHPDCVPDDQGVTQMMSTDFDSQRGVPKTWTALHDNFRCFLMSLAVTQDLTASPLWVSPLRIFAFLDEFTFYTRGMTLKSAHKFRVDMLDWLREAVTDTCSLSKALEDASAVMVERSKLIEYAGGGDGGGSGGASANEPACAKCAKKDKELTAAKSEIASLKEKRAEAESARNRDHNSRARSVSRGPSESRPRSDGRRVRLQSPVPERRDRHDRDRHDRHDRDRHDRDRGRGGRGRGPRDRRSWSRSPRRR